MYEDESGRLMLRLDEDGKCTLKETQPSVTFEMSEERIAHLLIFVKEKCPEILDGDTEIYIDVADETDLVDKIKQMTTETEDEEDER